MLHSLTILYGAPPGPLALPCEQVFSGSLPRAAEAQPVANVRKVLDDMSRAELIQVIEKMAKLQPDLLSAVLPGLANQQIEQVMRKARADLSRGNNQEGWNEKARGFQRVGEHALASRLFQLIVEETLPIRNEIESEREVTEFLSEAVSNWLASVRKLKSDSAERRQALQGLFLVIQADAAEGGIGLSDDILPWLEALKAPEAELMLGWVENEIGLLPSARRWQRERWAEVAGKLLPRDDLAGFLAQHKISGSLFTLLAEQRDFQGAIEAGRQQLQGDEEARVGLADQLRDAGQLPLARQLMIEGPDRWRNWDWLARHYTKPGERELALESLLRCWSHRQDLTTYQRLSLLSQKLKTWNQLGPQLLEQVPANWLRVEILMEEKAFEEAWGLADRLQGGNEVVIDLARKSAALFPLRAAQALLSLARWRVDRGKSRSAYREAGPWVRDALAYLAKAPASERVRLLAPWAETYRRLPALQDEWSQLGISL